MMICHQSAYRLCVLDGLLAGLTLILNTQSVPTMSCNASV